MTHHPDKAREAAWEQFIRGERTSPKADFFRSIDAFLAASLPADVGEVTMGLREFASAERKRHGGKTNVYEATLADRAADTIALLVHKCHMHAVARKHIAEDFARREDELSAKLAAQKAAHAKMLRDEADRHQRNLAWAPDGHLGNTHSAETLRHLADKIEGGE